MSAKTFRMQGVPLVLPLVLLGLSPPHEGAGAMAQPSAAPTGSIVAVLAPPSTNYTADLTDPEGGTLTFAWSAGLSCGTFQPGTPTADKAIWNHGGADGCPHKTPSHPGTITVVVSDPEGNEVICVYDGSLSGQEPCQSALPLLSIDDVRVDEPDEFAVFHLSLSAPTDNDVTATVSTSAVSACEALSPERFLDNERNDYGSLVDPTFVIPAGETSASLPVPIFDDLLDERAETFSLVIGTAPGATIADGQGRGTIMDDDPKARLVLVPDVLREERGPAKPLIRFSDMEGFEDPSGKVVRVTVATEDGTARAGSDYRAREQALTIEPPGCGERGKISLPFKVGLIDDTRAEHDETFFVVLRDPVNAILGAPASVIIFDDD